MRTNLQRHENIPIFSISDLTIQTTHEKGIFFPDFYSYYHQMLRIVIVLMQMVYFGLLFIG